MRQSIPKRHHFVPKVVLKRFVDQAGWLHYYAKREGRIRPTRVDNAFVEGHLYSEIADQGRKVVAVEQELNAVETRAEPVLDKLIQSARSGRLPGLSVAERNIWDEFFIVQWRRVPDLNLEVATDAEVVAQFALIRERMKAERPDLAPQIDALGEPDEEKVVLKNARARSVCGVSDRVRAVQRSHGIALARVTTPGKSLLIGSRPVVQLIENRLRLLGHATEMWLPIASDVAVGVGRFYGMPGFQPPEIIVDLKDHREIRRFNLAIAAQSSSFASSSRSLTASIAYAR